MADQRLAAGFACESLIFRAKYILYVVITRNIKNSYSDDYYLIVIMTLERVFKNYYNIIQGEKYESGRFIQIQRELAEVCK